MEITVKNFGNLPGGTPAELFTLDTGRGMEVDITNYGGIITSIRIPDKHKQPGDVVLGFDTLEDYLGDHPYFGAIIGRFGNRIGKGHFKLDRKQYTLAKNKGNKYLHGGTKGFDKVLWTASKEKTLLPLHGSASG